MEQQLKVGVISSTHGIRGEVKVFPTTDDASRYKKLKHVFIDTGKEQIPMEITQVKFSKQFVIVKFKGIDTINEAEQYKSMSLLINREDAVPLGQDEYYIADMIGMQVYTEDGELFGELTDIMKTGANDVYVIQTKEQGEVLVPAIRQCVHSVDVAGNRMEIRLMEGLI